MSNWPQISLNTNNDNNRCFGCGPDNPIGLKLKFQTDGKTVRAEFTPGNSIKAGPAIYTADYCLYPGRSFKSGRAYEGLNCVTARLDTQLKHLIPINEPIVITLP